MVTVPGFQVVTVLIHMLAGGHSGRGPGNGSATDNWGQTRGRGWVGYVNVEVLGQKHYWTQDPGCIQRGFSYSLSLRFGQDKTSTSIFMAFPSF